MKQNNLSFVLCNKRLNSFAGNLGQGRLIGSKGVRHQNQASDQNGACQNK
jgi:hypothetical protein